MTSSATKQSTVEKATEALEAANRKHGGPAGVVIDTGEVIGAAKPSRSRAAGRMDQLAGAIEDAKTTTPGASFPIGDDRDVDELIDERVDARGHEEGRE